MNETAQQAAQRLVKGIGTLAKVYEYADTQGNAVFWNLRITTATGKTFRMMACDGAGAFQLRRPEEQRPQNGWPLYGLHSLALSGRVWVVEGEKDVDSLHALGLPAVTSGASSTSDNADWTSLQSREVVLWPDNDDAGRTYIDTVAQALQPLGCDVVRIDPEALSLPAKGDASDWLALHPGASVDEVLALLPKVPTTAELLGECRRWIHRYCIVNRVQGIVLAAWVLHTWAIDAADFTPYIHITAPEKGCGKTQLLETLSKIVRRPWLTAGASAAVIFRKVHAEQPTLMLDETDAAFGGSDEYAEALRQVLNAGFKRTGNISRCEGKGAEMSYKDFNCYCPKAIAGIGKVPDTVASRSIVIQMQRKRKGETVERFRDRIVEAKARPLRDKLERWAKKNVPALKAAMPELPEEMADRQQDISEPLIAIADIAGEEWATDVRAGLMELFGSSGSEDNSYRVRLLKDIRMVLEERRVDRISSVELCSDLCEIEGQPWRDWSKGKGMDAGALAKLLREFSIYSGTIRIGSITAKGYMKSSFEDAWSRYCPVTPLKSRHSVTTRMNTGDLHTFEPSQEESCYPSKSEESPMFTRVVTCDGKKGGASTETEENGVEEAMLAALAVEAQPRKLVF